VRFYGQRLAQSASGDFVVTGSRIGSDGVIVTPSTGNLETGALGANRPTCRACPGGGRQDRIRPRSTGVHA
jgi:hypothetical protein